MSCGRCGDGVRKLKARSMCSPCYQHVRLRDQYVGTWSSYVDPGPAIEHAAALKDAGVSGQQLATLSGLSATFIYTLRPGRTRIQASKLDAVLAIPIPAPGGEVPIVEQRVKVCAVGTTRRLQALCALGWSSAESARRLGIRAQHTNLIVNGYQRAVLARTARNTATLYDELAMVRGPSEYARRIAARKGWWPPLAWDDDRIDDPAAIPTGVGRDRRLTFVEAYSELRTLGYYDDETIAAKMGIAVKSLQRQLTPSRHGKVSA
jgi:hypothetical protein